MLLAAGLDLVSVEGLSAVTLGELAAVTKMSKSGLFAHFGSKERLQLELLDAMVSLAQRHVVAPAVARQDGLPRLRCLVERWFGWTKSAGLSGGCPLAAALFELDDLDGPVRERVMELEAEWRGYLTAMADAARERGEIGNGLTTGQFVWELCGIYLSHHASSRFLRDPAADSRARVAFAALLVRAGAKSVATHEGETP